MTEKKRFIRHPLVLMVLLLLACGNQNNKEQAEKHYQSALALFEANKADSAFLEIQRTIKLDPKHIKAHQRYANIMRWEKNQFEEVLAEYQEQASKHPRNEIYQYMLGYLSDDADEMKARAENSLKLNPKFYWGHVLLGSAYMREQDYTSSIEEYNKAIALDAGEPSVKYNLAFSYARIDSFDLSNQIYREILKADTTRYYAYYTIWGNIIDKEGDTPEVKEKITHEIDSLLAAKPGNLEIMQSAMYIFRSLREPTKVTALEEEMIKRDTTGNFSQSIVFERVFQIRDPNDRLKFCEKFLQDYPNSRMKNYMHSFIFRIVSTELKLDTTKIIEWGERRIKDCPDEADAYNDLVWQIYQYRQDKLDVALEYMKKAMEVAKPYQKNYLMDTMGWIYFKKAMYPEALSASEAANKLYDDPDADVIFHLGAAQGKNGKIEDALQTLALSLSLQENAEARSYFNEFYQAKFGKLDDMDDYLKKTILGKAMIDPPFAAPDFKLTSMDGREMGLSDFKDKVILVAFWKPT
ncbi:MAG: tetratricopeptide repeat protein [bacterium]|nr:tetratricopeptide repeat protein [bacterium]